jgi:hypothetical protein
MNLRQTFRGRKHWLRLAPTVVLMTFVISFTQITWVWAATFDLTTCNASELEAAVINANSNGVEDTINLLAGCTYIFTNSNLVINPDGGNPLSLQGNGATISGDNIVSPLLVLPGAMFNLGNVTLSNGRSDVGGAIFNQGGTLNITNSFLVNNSAVSIGGGIYNEGTVNITNNTFLDNTAGNGGGIYNAAQGTMTLTNSTLSGNSAATDGGGIVNYGMMLLTNSTIAGNSAASAGSGIINYSTLTLTSSSISNNTGGGIGGGLFNNSGASVTLTNSTLSGNTAVVLGGGIFNEAATLTLTNSTLSSNSAGSGGGIFNEGTINLGNTILANSSGGDCYNTATINPIGGNLVEDGSCGIAGALAGDPLLGGLTGAPAYFPLLSGSPAIDAGDNGICPSTDQRGAARPQDGNSDGAALCDLGSFEFNPTTDPTTQTGSVPPPPSTPICEDQNFDNSGVLRASVRDGLDYAVYCRLLYQNGTPVQWTGSDLYSTGSIGNQGVIDLGVQHAVDVFSPVGMTSFDSGIEICLRGSGTLIFLAARNAPRVAEVSSSHSLDAFPGFVCTTLFEPGTLALVHDEPR